MFSSAGIFSLFWLYVTITEVITVVFVTDYICDDDIAIAHCMLLKRRILKLNLVLVFPKIISPFYH